MRQLPKGMVKEKQQVWELIPSLEEKGHLPFN